MGPATLGWSFGDGATAAGGAVAHAFASTGPFDVTVTATDSVGNAASLTRPVTIAPLRRVRSRVKARWKLAAQGRRFVLLRLRVLRPPKRAVADLLCRGRHCPFSRISTMRVRRHRIDVRRAIPLNQRRFRPRQVLELRITAPNSVGKVVKYRLKRGKVPKGRKLCLLPGTTQPRRRCSTGG
jgi:hypothetical protein